MSKENVKLESLPGNADEFWEHAEVALHTPKAPPKCEHFFIHRTAREVECRNCHIGFFLGVRDRIDKGHIYSQNNLVI